MNQPRLSHILLLATSSLFLLFAIIRRDPQKVEHSPLIWLVTVCGTLMPLALFPAGSEDLFIGDLLQSLGSVFQIAALGSLNRSFGALPAYRGIKSTGCYRLVRHPLYCAYAVGLIGFVINNLSVYNFVILFIDMGFQVVRIRYEEGLLYQYQDYVVYAGNTKWRLIPFLW